MPLLKFHLYKGRSTDELNRLLDVAHDAMVKTFEVPAKDRYQVVNEHHPSHMRALDTGLGIPRTENSSCWRWSRGHGERLPKSPFTKIFAPPSKRNAAYRPPT